MAAAILETASSACVSVSIFLLVELLLYTKVQIRSWLGCHLTTAIVAPIRSSVNEAKRRFELIGKPNLLSPALREELPRVG
jgi:hypothetical protein